jgi:hypothetical protein
MLARLLNCGKLLRALITANFRKLKLQQQVNSLADGKNIKDWTIRSENPKGNVICLWIVFNDLKGVGLKEIAFLMMA